MRKATRKEKQVTRTISTTLYEVMQIDLTTKEVSNAAFTYVGDALPEEKALQYIKEDYETDNIKVVALVSATTESHLYAIPESTFYEFGTIVDK